MARELRGRVIVVTGASAGIGAATAVEAGRAGMRVVLAARRRDRLDAVAQRVTAVGGEALVVVCDVADAAQVDALFAAALDRFGRVDVLYANAGYGFMQAADATDRAADERAMWATNYFGTVACCRAAAAVMRRQGAGHIVICSSIVGRIGLPYYSTYAATKAAQHAYAASLRCELEPCGIDVSCVYPIGTRTEFGAVSAAMSGREPGRSNTPAAFVQSAEHVARRILRCLRRPRPEVWPGRVGWLGAVLFTMCPRLHRTCFRSHTRRCSAAHEAAQRTRDDRSADR